MDVSLILFINTEAADLNTLLLNEDWNLEKINNDVGNIYTIKINNKPIDWIIKVYGYDLRHIKREAEILQILQDKVNVPKILAINYRNKKCPINYIIMSKVKGIDLFEYIERYGPFSEHETRNIIKQLLNIVDVLHKNNIIHKDIKPENILYDEKTETITLIDFEGKETADYMSPERYKGENFSFKCDVWSIGITCYYLLNGDVPFNSKSKILHSPLRFRKICNLEIQDFLSSLIERNVILRYSVIDALNHIWLNDN